MTTTNQVTINFNKEEFACKDGCGFMEIDVGLVNRLQLIRDILQEPITILSGCRCEKHNKLVKGKPNSYHLKGEAIDYTIEDWNKLARFGIHMDDKYSGGWHYYPSQHFIHMDVGPKRRW